MHIVRKRGKNEETIISGFEPATLGLESWYYNPYATVLFCFLVIICFYLRYKRLDTVKLLTLLLCKIIKYNRNDSFR